jgi:hypothetical protein
MIIRVDGHDIPVLTQADLTGEQLAEFVPVHAEIRDGHMTPTRLLGSTEKATLYDVSIPMKLGTKPGPHIRYTLVRPPGGDVELNLAAIRPMRIAGQPVQEADVLHQIQLFHAIGAITVAGGHVEMAMRKVYLSLTGENRDLASPEVSGHWANLEDLLEKLCDNTTDVRKKLKDVLDWSAEKTLRDRRNDAIHAYWWLFKTDGWFHNSRYYPTKKKQKQSQPPVGFVVRPEAYHRLASMLFEFANRLEALVTPDWPIAIVPPRQLINERLVELDPRLDVVDVTPTVRRMPTKPKPGQKPQNRKKGNNRGKRKKR